MNFQGISSQTVRVLEYLAIPYSHPDSNVREERFNMANRIAADLIRQGRFIFSPISHSHPITPYDTPQGWDFWEKFDRIFLEICPKMIVVKADGWLESKGIMGEIKIFRELGKGDKIEFITP
jgi:hypothetical protein